jgi:6-phosphofructokinase 2
VNVRPVWVESTTRPSLTLQVREDSTNYRIVGSSEPVSEYEYLPVLGRLQEIQVLPPHVVLSGSFPPGVPATFLHDIAQVTHDRGSRLVVDTSGDALRAAVDEQVAVLEPSREERVGTASERA